MIAVESTQKIRIRFEARDWAVQGTGAHAAIREIKSLGPALGGKPGWRYADGTWTIDNTAAGQRVLESVQAHCEHAAREQE